MPKGHWHLHVVPLCQAIFGAFQVSTEEAHVWTAVVGRQATMVSAGSGHGGVPYFGVTFETSGTNICVDVSTFVQGIQPQLESYL